MRNVPISLTQADLKRLSLANRAEEFGLPSPTEKFEERGFYLHLGSGDLHIRFKGHEIATARWPNRLEVVDHVPAEADAMLTALINGIRDTAKRIDGTLRADKRALQAKIDRLSGGPDTFPMSDADLYVVSVFPNAIDPDIRLRFHNDYDGSSVCGLFAQSPTFPENSILVSHAFTVENGMARRGAIALRDEIFEDMISHAHACYKAVIADLGVKALAAVEPFTERELAQIWTGASVAENAQGFSLDRDTRSRISLHKNGVPILSVLVNMHGGEGPTFSIKDGGLPDPVRNGLVSMVKGLLATQKYVAQESYEDIPKEQLGFRTVEALSEIDLGYGL